jgi:hypothetical protein
VQKLCMSKKLKGLGAFEGCRLNVWREKPGATFLVIVTMRLLTVVV